jgi:hypothetical protein
MAMPSMIINEEFFFLSCCYEYIELGWSMVPNVSTFLYLSHGQSLHKSLQPFDSWQRLKISHQIGQSRMPGFEQGPLFPACLLGKEPLNNPTEIYK